MPVVHLGQPEAVEPVLAAILGTRWLVVALTCPRDIAAQRITARATGDTDDRLRLWDQTPPLTRPDAITVDTSARQPDEAAELIHRHATALTATA